MISFIKHISTLETNQINIKIRWQRKFGGVFKIFQKNFENFKSFWIILNKLEFFCKLSSLNIFIVLKLTKIRSLIDFLKTKTNKINLKRKILNFVYKML